jgi:hypothetical protein
MKKLVTIVFTVAVVIAFFGAYHHVRAAGNERPYSPLKGAPSAPVVLTSHTLLTTYIDQGQPDVEVGSGFVAIDNPVTIHCQSVSGCTIGAESWAEVGGLTTADEWAICTEVDGEFAGICTFQGSLPTSGAFVTGSINNAVGVAVGTHTVQAFVYNTASGAELAQYNNTYHLYRP